MSKTSNYLEELNAIKEERNDKEIKISQIKGRTDSLQEEVNELTEELESKGLTFDTLADIESFKQEKEARIEELITNYKSELSIED